MEIPSTAGFSADNKLNQLRHSWQQNGPNWECVGDSTHDKKYTQKSTIIDFQIVENFKKIDDEK